MPIMLALLSGCSLFSFCVPLTPHEIHFSGTLEVPEGFVDAVDGCVLYPDGILTPYGFSGKFGIGEGEFASPAAIEVEGGRIYVLDRGKRKIMVFTLRGEFLFEFGENLEDPVAFSLDGLGRVYVLDRVLYSVLVFTTGGEYLYSFGSYGTGDAFFENPSLLCAWGNKVAVKDKDKIKVFDYRGEFLYSIRLPAISMDAGKRLYVLLPDGLYLVDGKRKRLLSGRWERVRAGKEGIYLIKNDRIEVYTW